MPRSGRASTRLWAGLVCCLLGGLGTTVAAAADGRVVVLRADGVQVWFDVELALSAAQRARGLMQRAVLAPRSGMWFDFGREVTVAMWMKDTPLALDMAFVDAAGHVLAVQHDVQPLDETLITAPRPVRYVLEVGAGRLAALGIGPGDRMLLRGAGGRGGDLGADGSEGAAKAGQ